MAGKEVIYMRNLHTYMTVLDVHAELRRLEGEMAGK
jgi:hypothetical protein